MILFLKYIENKVLRERKREERENQRERIERESELKYYWRKNVGFMMVFIVYFF